ncbi:MAG: hypothetical protein A2341_21515 [Deltaproteobacteria bacterium RIFOXYB12_FULL_58_9]|nr:MAG: hypothetical protein A2341_21515 [Deltaproteobacteria bacterium RIFOXYB12_FULL_58_9]
MATIADKNHHVAVRYDSLAESACCLSCGGARDLARPVLGEICIDLGSGRGTDALAMADEVGAQGHVYGVDAAEKMLARGRRDANKLGVENVTFCAGTLDNTSLNAGIADVVISNCAINHANDKEAVWREVFRVLKPGGRFVVSDIYSLREVPKLYRDDPEAVAQCWAGASTRDEYLATLARVGFDAIEILEESEPYKKGEIEVASWTVRGFRPEKKCCCCS